MSVVASTPTFSTPASAKAPASTTGPAGAVTTPARAVTTPTGAVTTPTAPLSTSTAVQPFNSTAINARTHAPARSHSSGHVSTEAIALAVIAAVLLLACAAWAFARSRAYEPHWLVSLRHAMAEAGYRTSGTWAEFTDWARIGR
jgi:hypothetical protein